MCFSPPGPFAKASPARDRLDAQSQRLVFRSAQSRNRDCRFSLCKPPPVNAGGGKHYLHTFRPSFIPWCTTTTGRSCSQKETISILPTRRECCILSYAMEQVDRQLYGLVVLFVWSAATWMKSAIKVYRVTAPPCRGGPTPSQADIQMTQKIVAGAVRSGSPYTITSSSARTATRVSRSLRPT
jgi:hypothetical protein